MIFTYEQREIGLFMLHCSGADLTHLC